MVKQLPLEPPTSFDRCLLVGLGVLAIKMPSVVIFGGLNGEWGIWEWGMGDRTRELTNYALPAMRLGIGQVYWGLAWSSVVWYGQGSAN